MIVDQNQNQTAAAFGFAPRIRHGTWTQCGRDDRWWVKNHFSSDIEFC